MSKVFEFIKVAWSFWGIYQTNKDVLKTLYKNINDLLIMLANAKTLYDAGNLKSVDDVLKFIDIEKVKEMIITAQTSMGTADKIGDDIKQLYIEEFLQKVE